MRVRMPLRFLRGDYTRLALMIVALSCGVALVCALDLVNRAVLRAFVEIVDAMAGRAALQVTPGGNAFFPEEVADTVAGVAGVALAVPVVTSTAYTTDGSGELLTVHGIDITNDDAVRIYDARDERGLEVDDPLVVLSQPDSILLTKTFAIRHGLRRDDHLELSTPTGVRTFTVRGLIEPNGVARIYGGNLVVMDVYAAEAAFARPHYINRVDVVVKADAETRRVAEEIASALPNLRVETPRQRQADIGKVVRSLQVLLSAIGLAGLAVAFLIAFNRLATVFEGRIWQVGILRAVGVRSRAVWWELLSESVFVGAIGVVIGIPLGVGIGRLLLPIMATTTALAYNLIVPDARLTVSASSLAVAAMLGMSTSILAAAIPAARTARLSANAILRTRGVEQPTSRKYASHALVVVAIAILITIVLQAATGAGEWGLVATALAVIATALAAGPLVRGFGKFLSLALHWFGGPAARFAAAVIVLNSRRTILTVATLAVGFGSVVWLWVVGKSFEDSVLEVLTPAFQSDLIVSSAQAEAGVFESPVGDVLEAELAAVPGVRSVSGERVTDWQYGGGPIVIEAFDPSYFTDGSFGRWPLLESRADVWGAVGRGQGVVVSSSLVRSLPLHVGGSITLQTPRGLLTLEIMGVTLDFASPRGTVKISRQVYRKFWNDDQITLAFVRSARGVPIEEVRARIAKNLGMRYRLRVLSSGELVEYYASQVRRAFSAVDALAGMVFAVILVGVADTLAAGVVERTRELGVMRAVGTRRSGLRRMVLVESAALAVMGMGLALPAGVLLGTLWVRTTFPDLLGWVLELHLPYVRMALGGIVMALVCLIAALIPARRAAGLQPAVALRHE